MIPILTSERLTLRGPGPQDVPAITDFYASDRARYVGGPKEADQAWRQLAAEIGHWSLCGYGRWMIDVTDTGQTVGMAGLWYPEGWPEPEIGWDLFEGFEGQGYATEAARAARDYAQDKLGWQTAISLVNPENIASARVAMRVEAWLEGAIDHPRLGHLDLYRHPGPSWDNTDTLAPKGAA